MLFLQLLVNGVVTGCALGVVAFSFAMVYFTTRVFHVAHAGLYTLAGYLAWSLSGAGVPDGIGILVAAAVCALLGAAMQAWLYAPLERKRAPHLVVLIASLGALAVMQNLIAGIYSPNILSFQTPWRSQVIAFAGIQLSMVQIATLLTSLVLFAATLWFTQRTTLGRRIRAVAANPFLAEITRLEPRRVHVIVIAIASAIVAVPGVLVGADLGLQPYSGTTVLLTGTVAMIAGGIGSLTGTFVLSIAITVIQNLTLLVMPGQWSIGVTFFIFVIFMLFRPRGLFASA